VTLQSEHSGAVRIKDISPWGSARWAGRMAKNDEIRFVDGAPVKGLSARQVVELINGAPDAGSTVELVFVRQLGAAAAAAAAAITTTTTCATPTTPTTAANGYGYFTTGNGPEELSAIDLPRATAAVDPHALHRSTDSPPPPPFQKKQKKIRSPPAQSTSSSVAGL
jgi:C-terminal processing protease CtpA/Prc